MKQKSKLVNTLKNLFTLLVPNDTVGFVRLQGFA